MNTPEYVQSLKLENFSLLPNETFQFSPHLNIIIAENACGKSHLLKLLYTLLAVTGNEKNALHKTNLQKIFADKLLNVFRPDSLGRLVKRQQGSSRCEVELRMNSGSKTSLTFSNHASSQVNIKNFPNEYNATPAFLPTRELLTLCPWFISLYQTQNIPFDETWVDTCQLLNVPTLKGVSAQRAQLQLQPLEDAMGDRVVVDSSGRFYLGKVEAPLVAEGVRKLMMIARLIANGALLDKGYLFWDEPEANLNPRFIRVAAEMIFQLSQQNIQVFIATHSLFLLRELEILQDKHKKENDEHIKMRYFSLTKDKDIIRLQQTDNYDDVESIVALDESLAQSDRYSQI
ncbi:AAA family ATPase [Alysiella filiformis]|uniref:ATPase/GTPase, AAA15 family n=1 Tax=Alysiella filiformis DSM 16848 TaxID=1120981 RepID=A0A286E8G0_9NEIS|nr:ATP-binding protein [Alysiella filiformis]QMT32084.1 AAA family ATPase [Alysiella filiformis]UBQ57006.1 AAA family ATPase [Alysiella filiformis DSM 16848]SOD67205.1 ATPase/GTPase, AAA15 family [Alysiella filiformis DSM 16848]